MDSQQPRISRPVIIDRAQRDQARAAITMFIEESLIGMQRGPSLVTLTRVVPWHRLDDDLRRKADARASAGFGVPLAFLSNPDLSYEHAVIATHTDEPKYEATDRPLAQSWRDPRRVAYRLAALCSPTVARTRRSQLDAYGYTTAERDTIRRAAVPVALSTEIAIAEQALLLANDIVSCDAWTDPLLSSHRDAFHPEDEADAIMSEALTIAAYRIEADDRDDDTLRRTIDIAVTALTDRFIALRCYATTLADVNESIRRLRKSRDEVAALGTKHQPDAADLDTIADRFDRATNDVSEHLAILDRYLPRP